MVPGTSATKQLTRDEIKAFRLEIDTAYTEGMNKVEKAFEQGSLTQSRFDDAVGQLQRLKLLSTKLLGLIISGQLGALLDTNKDSPASKIRIATDNLKNATQNIQNFLDFLQSIAEVIRIASGIILAIQTGVIAKI